MVYTVLILAGGPSNEHAISLISASNIAKQLINSGHGVHMVGIDAEAQWWLYERPEAAIEHAADPKRVTLANSGRSLVRLSASQAGAMVKSVADDGGGLVPDVVFPVLHGTYGEDGVVQGMLEGCGAKYVGCGVAASAVSMDKDMCKRLLREAGIDVAPGYTWLTEQQAPSFDAVSAELGLPCFVKPAREGSSVGVSKVNSNAEYNEALALAKNHDSKVLIEGAIIGQEVECAVLGNTSPKASILGEIIPHHDFYSYDAKYIDPDGAGLVIPANVSESMSEQIRDISCRAFRAVEGRGLARIDFLVDKEGRIVLNEINTFPGFTAISMYPKLWEHTGLSYGELLNRLIELALEK